MSEQSGSADQNKSVENISLESIEEANTSCSESDGHILTLDATLNEIPNHTRKIINDLLKIYNNDKTVITKFDLFNALLNSIALECGFLDSNILTAGYSVNSNYSFDKYMLTSFAQLSSASYRCRCKIQNFKYRFINQWNMEIFVLVMETGDFVLVTSSLLNKSSCNLDGFSLSLPISRYIPILHFGKIERSFRNLRELSIKLKNEIFLPLRNQIYQSVMCLNPSLQGTSEILMIHIVKYLKRRDIRALKLTCKAIYVTIQHLNL